MIKQICIDGLVLSSALDRSYLSYNQLKSFIDQKRTIWLGLWFKFMRLLYYILLDHLRIIFIFRLQKKQANRRYLDLNSSGVVNNPSDYLHTEHILCTQLGTYKPKICCLW